MVVMHTIEDTPWVPFHTMEDALCCINAHNRGQDTPLLAIITHQVVFNIHGRCHICVIFFQINTRNQMPHIIIRASFTIIAIS